MGGPPRRGGQGEFWSALEFGSAVTSSLRRAPWWTGRRPGTLGKTRPGACPPARWGSRRAQAAWTSAAAAGGCSVEVQAMGDFALTAVCVLLVLQGRRGQHRDGRLHEDGQESGRHATERLRGGQGRGSSLCGRHVGNGQAVSERLHVRFPRGEEEWTSGRPGRGFMIWVVVGGVVGS